MHILHIVARLSIKTQSVHPLGSRSTDLETLAQLCNVY